LKNKKDKKQGGYKEGITSDTITMEEQVIYCSNVPALCAVIVLEDTEHQCPTRSPNTAIT
jgi:hypothetical protein